jgi:type VI protein secretion system component VasF
VSSVTVRSFARPYRAGMMLPIWIALWVAAMLVLSIFALLTTIDRRTANLSRRIDRLVDRGPPPRS